MTRHRSLAVGAVVLLAAALTACAPALPDSVVAGTTVTVGWHAELTSMNAGAAPTAGNIDIAQATRADFGDVTDGAFVADESFGTVSIVADDPFTVRYDLAEPSWSDGIPLDAADLLLGWAASAGYLSDDADQTGGEGDDDAGEGAEDAGDGDAEASAGTPAVPVVDEFARAIEVTFAAPTIAWQTAISVPVAAHIVGERAFGLDDPMAAKQAVLTALEDDDTAAIAAIAKVWRDDFTVSEGELPADLLLSSGPYQISKISRDDAGQRVTLVPNAAYAGAATPSVAQIDLVPVGDDPVGEVGEAIDIVRVAPTAENAEPINELERRDFGVQITHDDTVWAVLLSPRGVFAKAAARTAFLSAVPASDMVDRGAGEWMSAYTASTSMVSAPGSRAYDIVSEDSGFTEAFTSSDDKPDEQRAAAGVSSGATVCVLYDRRSDFAGGAFAALREAGAEAGWGIADCGSDDIDAAYDKGGWNAAIVRVSLPQTPDEIAAQWGSGGSASLLGLSDDTRDELIAQLAQTVDVYEGREVLAQIEATIVRAAVARPLAVNPVLTVIDRDVVGVTARNGAVSPLLYGVSQWAVVQ